MRDFFLNLVGGIGRQASPIFLVFFFCLAALVVSIGLALEVFVLARVKRLRACYTHQQNKFTARYGFLPTAAKHNKVSKKANPKGGTNTRTQMELHK